MCLGTPHYNKLARETWQRLFSPVYLFILKAEKQAPGYSPEPEIAGLTASYSFLLVIPSTSSFNVSIFASSADTIFAHSTSSFLI